MTKKILISLSVIAVVAAVVVGGTIAYFSDTETSTGNTFTAGAIDLTIDNESYVTDASGVLVASAETSWELNDLTNELFFNFTDLKPGDIGEDTISLHVDSNDAWVCMSIDLTSTPENGVTEPEGEIDQTPDVGELQDELYFAFWADDGDNVYEVGEEIFAEGLAGVLLDGTNMALADSQKNVWGATVRYTGNVLGYSSTGWGGHSCPIGTTATAGGTIGATQAIAAEGLAVNNIDSQSYPVYPHYTFPTGETGYVVHNGQIGQDIQIWVDCASNDSTVKGGQTYYIGKVWCYGNLTETPFAQGEDSSPLVRGTGFVCDGSPVSNVSQTDGITADVEFYAEQSRNNPNFVCPQPRRITSVDGTGWASVDGQFTEAWQGDGRWGDGGTTAAENEVRIGMPGGGSPIVQAHGDNTTGPWRNDVWEDFNLTFISPQQATLSIGDVSIDTGVGSTIPGADGKFGITIKTKSSGETVMVQNVKLDGISPSGPDAISASNGAKASLVLSGATELSDGFIVTGQVKLSWSSTPTSNESMGILFQIEN